MNSLQPRETPYDLYFSIAGIPVRVHPLFWVVAGFLGVGASDAFAFVGWIIAAFVAVVVHELGHALAMRLYGYSPRITLYGLGGYTEYGVRDVFVRPPRTGGRILISAAGPAAGFCLAVLLTILLTALGHRVHVFIGLPLGIYLIAELPAPWLTDFVNSLFFVTIGWGILNLLPVLPLDGGQIMREILGLFHPTWGTLRAVQFSFLVGAAVAFWAALSGSFFLAVLFGYLAYTNYQILKGPPLW